MRLLSDGLLVSVHPFSARETEVLEQLARGESNAEIGATLYITEGTVKTHLNAIFEKLRVRTRLEAVLAAQAAGLVDVPGQLSPEAVAILALHRANPHALAELRAKGYL